MRRIAPARRWLFALVQIVVCATWPLQNARARDLRLTLEGPPATVFDSARDGCAPVDVPDINARAYRDKGGNVALFALHYVNRALRGRDIDHLKLDCTVLLDSPHDADPAAYADRNFIAATWTLDGETIDALVHHEYHADEHGRCRVQGDLGCWYNTILAYHGRDGEPLTKADPPVVAAAPFTQDVNQGRHRGFFNPSNIFSDGTYTYAFISTTGWAGQDFGNCLFRTRDPADPTSWRAFDGAAFSIRYRDPYKGPSHPKPCLAIKPFTFPVGAVVRHRATGLWLAVFQASAGGPFPLDGFYYATARDLIHWGTPRLLLPGKTLYSDLCKAGPSIIAYPSLLDPSSVRRNFDGTGERPELFFTTMQVASCATGRRMLVRAPARITVIEGEP